MTGPGVLIPILYVVDENENAVHRSICAPMNHFFYFLFFCVRYNVVGWTHRAARARGGHGGEGRSGGEARPRGR